MRLGRTQRIERDRLFALGKKRCTKCGETKALSQFNRRKCSRDGHHSRCKLCVRKAVKRYRETEKGREAHQRYNKSEKGRASNRVRGRRYMQGDQAKMLHREANRRYHQTEKGRENHHQKKRRRHGRYTGATGSHTRTQFIGLCQATELRCLRCGQDFPLETLTEDHVVPLSKGGSDDISNIQPLCHSCNASKGTQNTDYRTGNWQTRPKFAQLQLSWQRIAR